MQTEAIIYVWTKSNSFNDFSCIGSNRIVVDNETNLLREFKSCELYEYNGLSVKFSSCNPNDVLKIDSCLSDTPIKVKPGEEVQLTSCGSNDLMFTPGFYGYSIESSLKTYKGVFFIKPSSIEWDNLINLTGYLENIFSGLSKNLYIQRMLGQDDTFTESNIPLIEIYNHIYKNRNILTNCINSIIQNPITNITKEYREQFNSTKLDGKSERWLFKKGYNKNQNWYVPEITLGKHSILSYDCVENMYVKKILSETIKIIEKLEVKYRQVYAQIIEKQSIKKFLLNESQKKLDTVLSKDYSIGKRYKGERKNQIISLSNEIPKLDKKICFFKNILDNLIKIKSTLIYFIHESWMKDLTNYYKVNRVSYGVLRDRRYYQLYNFYQTLLSLESNNKPSTKLNFSNKPTYKLFEYYSVVISIQSLLDLGFIWENGWLANNNEICSLNGEIPIEEPMIFINQEKNFKAIMYYDKKIKMDTDVFADGKNDFGRGGSPNDNPDISIAFFDLKTEFFLKAFIIEVKCRKSKNLVSKNGPSEVMEQINSYFYLNFYDFKVENEDDACKIGKIDRVIALYPRQNNPVPIKKFGNKIKFIQIEASESPNISEHYGYNNLKNEFIEVMSESEKERK